MNYASLLIGFCEEPWRTKQISSLEHCCFNINLLRASALRFLALRLSLIGGESLDLIAN